MLGDTKDLPILSLESAIHAYAEGSKHQPPPSPRQASSYFVGRERRLEKRVFPRLSGNLDFGLATGAGDEGPSSMGNRGEGAATVRSGFEALALLEDFVAVSWLPVGMLVPSISLLVDFTPAFLLAMSDDTFLHIMFERNFWNDLAKIGAMARLSRVLSLCSSPPSSSLS